MPDQSYNYELIMSVLLDRLFLFQKNQAIFNILSTRAGGSSATKKPIKLVNCGHRYQGIYSTDKGTTQLNHVLPQAFLKPFVKSHLLWSPVNLVAVHRDWTQVVEADANIDIPSLIGAASSYATYAASNPQPDFFNSLTPPYGIRIENDESRYHYIQRVLGEACHNWGVLQGAVVVLCRPKLDVLIDQEKIKLGQIVPKNIWWLTSHTKIPLNDITVLAFNDTITRSAKEVRDLVTNMLTPRIRHARPYTGSVLSRGSRDDKKHMPRAFRDFQPIG